MHHLRTIAFVASITSLGVASACAPAGEPASQSENVTDVPDSSASLCADTGGVWEDGSCACEQDGASIGFEFDATEGCGRPSVDAATLCADTGGVWEGGSCACEQDGASIGFEFDAAEGCGWPSVEPIAATLRGEGESLESYVDAERGVYVVTRPGAIDALAHQDGITDAEAWGFDAWILDELSATSCTLQDEMPALGCEAEEQGVYPSGCFHEATRDYAAMSSLVSFMEEYDFGTWSDEEKQAIARAESQVRARVALADAGITLYFGRDAGRWLLLVVDAAEQDCSA